MLILIFIIGFMLLSSMARRSSLLEKVGFALPIGMAAVTLAMLLMDWAHIALTRTSMTILTLTLLLTAVAANGKTLIAMVHKRPSLHFSFNKLHFKWFNLLWLLMLMGVIWLEYVNLSKCLIYPTYDRDSMAAFDTFGYVCAQEGTYLRMSLFDADYIPSLHHAGSAMSYVPMLPLSYAYLYIYGAATSKAIPALIYLGFLFGLYGLCRRRLTHTASMLVLLGVILTPEMTSFASHSITNVMHACVASAAIIYLCLWLERREPFDLRLMALMLAINVWMRAEGVVFIGVALIFIFISLIKNRTSTPLPSAEGESIRPKSQWWTIALPVLAVLPFLLWTVCSSTCGLASESTLITHPFWDGDKLLTVWRGVYGLLGGSDYYGWTFNIALIMLHVHIFYAIYLRLRHQPLRPEGLSLSHYLIWTIMIGIAGYVTVLYQVDYQWDSIQNVLDFSAKRFLFCFVPMAWFFSVSVVPMRKFATWFERKCGIGNL